MFGSIITITEILCPFFMRLEKRKLWILISFDIFLKMVNYQNIGITSISNFGEYILNGKLNYSMV
jgi:hypothetical protein